MSPAAPAVVVPSDVEQFWKTRHHELQKKAHLLLVFKVFNLVNGIVDFVNGIVDFYFFTNALGGGGADQGRAGPGESRQAALSRSPGPALPGPGEALSI